jgi:hypothetical protein
MSVSNYQNKEVACPMNDSGGVQTLCPGTGIFLLLMSHYVFSPAAL